MSFDSPGFSLDPYQSSYQPEADQQASSTYPLALPNVPGQHAPSSESLQRRAYLSQLGSGAPNWLVVSNTSVNPFNTYSSPVHDSSPHPQSTGPAVSYNPRQATVKARNLQAVHLPIPNTNPFHIPQSWPSAAFRAGAWRRHHYTIIEFVSTKHHVFFNVRMAVTGKELVLTERDAHGLDEDALLSFWARRGDRWESIGPAAIRVYQILGNRETRESDELEYWIQWAGLPLSENTWVKGPLEEVDRDKCTEFAMRPDNITSVDSLGGQFCRLKNMPSCLGPERCSGCYMCQNKPRRQKESRAKVDC
ncbi:hypothetical protein F66182_1557 [Fusarium sp. NRRL 66182]|nr:hypothetical protein F66182_1557 [Fusarium sp. NRRL 66182]